MKNTTKFSQLTEQHSVLDALKYILLKRYSIDVKI